MALEPLDQILLVVAPQPHGPARLHQTPDALHARLDPRTAVDRIAAEDQAISGGKLQQQLIQRIGATMNVTDHPVVCSALGGRHADGALDPVLPPVGGSVIPATPLTCLHLPLR